jgi:hypothetical protein
LSGGLGGFIINPPGVSAIQITFQNGVAKSGKGPAPLGHSLVPVGIKRFYNLLQFPSGEGSLPCP